MKWIKAGGEVWLGESERSGESGYVGVQPSNQTMRIKQFANAMGREEKKDIIIN